MRRKVKNTVLKSITAVMVLVAFISMLSMETESASTTAIITGVLSLGWIGMFAFSNKWFEEMN